MACSGKHEDCSGAGTFFDHRAPRYPKTGLHARIEGRVVLQAVIDERGRIMDVRVLNGLPMGLDQAAVDTVRNWIFEPAKL